MECRVRHMCCTGDPQGSPWIEDEQANACVRGEVSMANIPRIAVVGSANTDLITFADAFPRSGETIFGTGFDLGFGGKGANQAVAARLCGSEVLMVAKVGNDLFGAATVKNFASFGIDTRHVRIIEGVPTGVAPIFVEPGGQNRI